MGGLIPARPGLRVSGGVAGDRKAKSVLGFTAYESYGCKRPTHRDRPPPKLEELDREHGTVLLSSERVFHSPYLNNSQLFTAHP